MSTREEIKEGVIQEIDRWKGSASFVKADAILDYLHSQGVVIKVEGELTILIPDGKKIARLIKDAGYVATEPLIKEVE